MMTIKQPIQVNAVSLITASFDMFSEKIRANYGLMATHISPKELLLLVTATPELPEGNSSMTSIVVNENEQNIRNVTLEVVNNVVNRILLEDHADFTYQDRVYITTVLNKLGIENINQFMKQVHTLRDENTSVYRLSQMYKNNIKLFADLSSNLNQTNTTVLEGKSSEESEQTRQRYFMHNNIYNRLGTEQIYSIIHLAQNSQNKSENELFSSELRTAEQLRISRELSIIEIKSKTFSDNSIMLNHINHYEIGDEVDRPITEEQVLAEGAAAVLLNITDNIIVSRVDTILSKNHFWFDLRKAISHSAQNSLMRFQSYHTKPESNFYLENEYSQQISKVYVKEANTISQFINEFTQLKTQNHLSKATSKVLNQTMNLDYLKIQDDQEIIPEESENKQIQVEKHFDTKMLAQVTQQMINGDRLKKSDQVPLIKPSVVIETQNSTNLSSEQLIYQLNKNCIETINEFGVEKTRLIERFEQVNEKRLGTNSETFLLQSFTMNQAMETVNKNFIKESQDNQRQLADMQMPFASNEEENLFSPPDQEVYHQQGTSKEIVSEVINVTTNLTEQLNQIDERNREIYKKMVDQGKVAEKQPNLSSPDKKKIIKDALRSIDNPQQVMKEILSATSEPIQNKPDYKNSVLDIVLANADEATRSIYETILQYENDPQQAISSGKIRQASMGEFEKTIREVNNNQVFETQNLINRENVKSEIIHEEIETVMERLQVIPKMQEELKNTNGYIKQKVPIIHRQKESNISEELLEIFEQQRKEEKHQVITNQVVSNETVNQKQDNNVNQQKSEHRTENIAEIVNQTINHQMAEITDRVYGQMERRLNSERSRRGWQ